jgi:hypothetical protein
MLRTSSLALSCLVLAGGLTLLGVPAVGSQETRPTGQITVYVSAAADDAPIKGRPVMISIVANGTVAQQSEIDLGSLKIFDKLPVGPYQVLAEGEGMVGVVKKGVAVTDKGDTELRFPMRPGRGVKVIEYAAGPPAWEEWAARLTKLEKAVEELKARK